MALLYYEHDTKAKTAQKMMNGRMMGDNKIEVQIAVIKTYE